MNDLNTGNVKWSLWGGLNDIFKNQSTTYGLGSSPNIFGGTNGNTSFDISAADQAKQSKLSYSLSNRSYDNRFMFTHSTGLNKKGWAFSFSASRRWAQESYIQGTSFDAYSLLGSIAKVLNSQHQISLLIFGAPSSRALSGSATEEVYELSNNHYYNANWGWQDGAKRNARVSKSMIPTAILRHQYYKSEKMQINSSASVQMGINKISSLDWYNAIDPRPDYYQKLPSNYINTNPLAATSIAELIKGNPNLLQIDWDRLYNANRSNAEVMQNVNGIVGNSFIGNRSLYVIGNDVEFLKKLSLANNLQYKINDNLLLSAGINYAFEYSKYYKQLQDLLGGDYFVNKNMFAIQQYVGNDKYAQNDLNHPNRVVKEGEKYRYNYAQTIHKSLAWAQIEADFKRFSGFAALRCGYTSFGRNGYYRSGLFEQYSFGKSGFQNFINYAIKMGAQYKFNGRNYLFANALYSADEPNFNNVFISPKIRNQSLEHSALQYTSSFEAGYAMKAPKLNIRAVIYATDMKNVTNIQRFYNDDPDFQSYVNFALREINTRNLGTELGFEYAVSPLLTLNAAAAIGQAFYTNRPKALVYNDNDTSTIASSKEVYIKNYYLGVGPQSAYSLGMTYNSKKFWFVKISGNYFDRNYIAVNPARRSVEAAELMSPNDPLFSKIFDQEKLPSFYTIDITGGKSIRLSKYFKNIKNGTTLYLNIGVNNLLNNQNIKLMGYEQLRYDFVNNNPYKFPNKYVFGMGATFFANLSIKF
jgi:hypothetical protein